VFRKGLVTLFVSQVATLQLLRALFRDDETDEAAMRRMVFGQFDSGDEGWDGNGERPASAAATDSVEMNEFKNLHAFIRNFDSERAAAGNEVGPPTEGVDTSATAIVERFAAARHAAMTDEKIRTQLLTQEELGQLSSTFAKALLNAQHGKVRTPTESPAPHAEALDGEASESDAQTPSAKPSVLDIINAVTDDSDTAFAALSVGTGGSGATFGGPDE